jgi:hypothetical protein
MKYGHYSDNQFPTFNHKDYKTNSHGFRCPEFSPLPDGGKNIAVLGCSHTFGEGLEQPEIWISQLEKLLNNKRLRFWNLAQPGASPDMCVRMLYASEKVLFPKIIIVCWPAWSRRERLDIYPISITSDDNSLKYENSVTDQNNFLKCVFQVEKFAEYNNAVVFHCFAQDIYMIPDTRYVLDDSSLRSCWPVWDNHHGADARRTIEGKPDLARDGIHYGTKHHRTFAENIYNRFSSKIK